jgi:photosystem II stability/assembly factor-like uncharacterized protein
MKTTNGDTWTPLPSGVTNNLDAVFFKNADTGWVTAYNNRLLKTTDGGSTWMIVTTPSTWPAVEMSSIFFPDDYTGYAAGSDGYIIKTTDGGETWVRLQFPDQMDLQSVLFFDPDTGYVAGGFGRIMKTTDGGATWSVYQRVTNNSLYSISFPDKKTGYAVGANGIILKMNNSPTGIKETSKPVDELFSIYPNPANHMFIIENKIKMPEEITLTILNLEGKQVLNRNLSAQKRNEMDVSTLAKGLYFVKIKTSSVFEIKKLVIQ